MLNGIGDKMISLTKFVLELDKKIGEWRQKEAEADFHCTQDKVVIQIKQSMILQHAAKHYTHKVYISFFSNNSWIY